MHLLVEEAWLAVWVVTSAALAFNIGWIGLSLITQEPLGARHAGRRERIPRRVLGVVGVVVYFVFGAYQYLTASGAPHQMERGKTAMLTALAGIVLALVAFGVGELVIDAVSNPVVTIDTPPGPN